MIIVQNRGEEEQKKTPKVDVQSGRTSEEDISFELLFSLSKVKRRISISRFSNDQKTTNVLFVEPL